LGRKWVSIILMSIVLAVAGCGNKSNMLAVNSEKPVTVAAPTIDVKGNEIGEATFVEDKDGVTISIKAEGLSPGIHGVHIHETGVCTPPEFTSAGSHFNPTHKKHGFDNPKGYHLGDLPNIEVDSEGKINATLTTAELTLKPNVENSLLDSDGSALVIHEKEDDLKTDPAGDSGARIACAAIPTK
jgi:Cu-Zn family superoxide dismutase